MFRPRYGDRAVTLLVREGQVTDEFVALARKPDRTAADEAHFTALKQDMADRLMASPPGRHLRGRGRPSESGADLR